MAHVPDAFTIELQAMCQAVDLAAQLGAIRIVVETASMLLAHAVNRCEPDFSRYAVPLEDLKMQMKVWFSSCTVQFCRREANSAAHTIARLGYACNVNEALLSGRMMYQPRLLSL